MFRLEMNQNTQKTFLNFTRMCCTAWHKVNATVELWSISLLLPFYTLQKCRSQPGEQNPLGGNMAKTTWTASKLPIHVQEKTRHEMHTSVKIPVRSPPFLDYTVNCNTQKKYTKHENWSKNSSYCWSWSVRTDHDQQHCYHHVPTLNQRLLLQLIGSW